jgi:hypothetical protein
MSSVGFTPSSPSTPSGLGSPTTEYPSNSFFPNGAEATANGRHSMSIVADSDNDEDEKDMLETRDSKFMLPFSVPTTANMIYMNGWGKFGKHNGTDVKESEGVSKAEDSVDQASNEDNVHLDRERLVVPFIPDNWMDKLDKQQAVAAN